MPDIIGSPTRQPPTLETTTVTHGHESHIHRRISWAAILGAVILAITVELLLNLLGVGIGLGTVNTNAGTTPDASSLGLGAGIWWIVSAVIALGFGGYVAAWFAGIELRWDGVLHGLVTWGIATLITVYLLSSAVGGIVGGSASALGGVTSALGNGVKDAAQPVAQAAGMSPDMIRQQADAYLQPASPDPAAMSPQDAQKDVATNLVTYARGGDAAGPARARIIAVMAAQQKISPADATKQFDDAQAKLKQTRDQAVAAAKNAADASAAAASKAAFAAFGTLLLGAIAAAIGGSMAVQRRVLVTQRMVR